MGARVLTMAVFQDHDVLGERPWEFMDFRVGGGD